MFIGIDDDICSCNLLFLKFKCVPLDNRHDLNMISLQ